jgi:hypothetical protein
MESDQSDYSLKDHRETAAEASRILNEKHGAKRFNVAYSVRYKTYTLRCRAAGFGKVAEYGDSAEEVARKAADLAAQDHIQRYHPLNPRDSFGNRLGGPNEQA